MSNKIKINGHEFSESDLKNLNFEMKINNLSVESKIVLMLIAFGLLYFYVYSIFGV